MKKQLLIIFFASAIFAGLLPRNATAQETAQPAQASSKFMFGITGGVSMPFGNFTKTDYDNPQSGFVSTGVNFGITGTWFINKNWGITELFSYHQYSYNGTQNMANGYKEAWDVDSIAFYWQGHNQSFNFLIGPLYTMEVGKKINVDLRLLGGFVNAQIAGFETIITDGGVTDPPFYQAKSMANTFGMQAGAALRYKLTKHFGIGVNVDFFYSDPDITVNNINRNNNNTVSREVLTYHQPMEGVNTNLTLLYSLHK